MPRVLQPPVVEIALGALMVALVVEEILTSTAGPTGLFLAAGLLTVLPLLIVRRVPLAAVAVAFVSWAIAGLPAAEQAPQLPLVPLLALLTASAAAASTTRARLCLGVALAGLGVHEPGDLIVMAPLFTGAWFVGRLLQDRRRTAALLAERADRLEAEQDEHARLAIAHERVRIARELHDVVAHGVSVMVMTAGAERLAIGDTRPATREALATIEDTGRSALVEMRRLFGVLRSDGTEAALSPQPGLARLHELARQMDRAGLPTDLSVSPDVRGVPAGLEISAYRIVQEALTNALRHAGAARATVDVHRTGTSLELEVRDDGDGPSGAPGGHGLLGMRERASVLGGSLDAGAGPHGGFVVRATLPLET